MQTPKNGLVLQIVFFGVFFLMGANVIGDYYLSEIYSWYSFTVLGLIILAGVAGFIVYKKVSNTPMTITNKEVKMNRILLYTFFGVYIIYIVLKSLLRNNEATQNDELFMILAFITAFILIAISIVGIVSQSLIFRKNKKRYIDTNN